MPTGTGGRPGRAADDEVAEEEVLERVCGMGVWAVNHRRALTSRDDKKQDRIGTWEPHRAPGWLPQHDRRQVLQDRVEEQQAAQPRCALGWRSLVPGARSRIAAFGR